MAMMVRIPLTITATATGHTTDGVLVAVMASDLDALEAENKGLRKALLRVEALLSHVMTMENMHVYEPTAAAVTAALAEGDWR